MDNCKSTKSFGSESAFFQLILRTPLLLMCIIQNVIFPPIFIVFLIILQPLRLVRSDLFWWTEGIVYDSYLGIVSSWTDLAGHRVLESGDDISTITHDEALLLVNHQSPSDIGTLMRCLHGKSFVFSRAIWVMDWVFQFFNFGWVSKCHGDFFLLQPTDALKLPTFIVGDITKSNANQQTKLRASILNSFQSRNRKWVIVFPEGGFLHKRRSGSQRYARKNNLPILEHVALPRAGAVHCVLDAVGIKPKDNHAEQQSNAIKWIIDVTIGYDRPIGVLEHIMGHNGPHVIRVHYRVLPAYDVIKANSNGLNTTDLTDWLFNLFYKKEKLLSYFYSHGCFPTISGKHAPTRSSPIRCDQIVLIHIVCAFFLLLLYSIF